MPKSDDHGVGAHDPDSGAIQASEMPTPPVGMPLGKSDSAGQDADEPPDATPPIGFQSASGVVSADDYGEPGPSVIGAGEAPEPESRSDAGEWPTLEYRSRNKQKRRSGGLGWLRRRRDSE